jgi:hypothetical protein
MTTTYLTEERYDAMMTAAYGLFVPGSDARAIRHENARHGLRTCWHCLAAFAPRVELDADGRRHRFGRGRWYCSRACSRADRRTTRRERASTIGAAGGELVIDLRRLRGAAA